MRILPVAALALALVSPALAQDVLGPYAPTARRVASGSSDNATAADFQNAIFWKSATTSNKSEVLPACTAGLNGRWLFVADEQGTAAAYPITVTAAAGNVGGSTSGLGIISNYGAARFACDGAATNWVVTSQFAPGTNVRAVTGTTDTILGADNGGLVTYNNAAAVAVILPQGTTAGFPASAFVVLLRNYGAGDVTITPTTSTINNGASSLLLHQNMSAMLVEDASGNYQAFIARGDAATIPLSIGWIAGQNPNNATLAVLNQAGTITSILGAVETALGATGTVTVYSAASGTACGSGSAVSTEMNANGTAAANQTLSSGTPAISAGTRLCLQTTGGSNWTSGSAVGGITVNFKPS